MSEQIAERFWSHVQRRGEDDCWLWSRRKDGQSYGSFYLNGHTRAASRVALILETGIDPEGLLACHHCDNPPCCNPKHLYWGTFTDNLNDASRRARHGMVKKTHCPQGHPYDAENTRIYRGWRVCRICWTTRGSGVYRNRKKTLSVSS